VDRKTNACTLALLLLAGAALCAQEYSFRSFGNAEGLSNLAVRRLYQDRVGFLWVSTENGIFRYDGERFEAFGAAQGMPPNSVSAFGDAPDGSLLVGGDFGLFHLRGNHFEKVAANFKTINWAQGIEADGRGHTYLGTDSGLVVLSSQPEQGWFSMQKLVQPPGASGPEAYGILVDGDVVWYGCGLELCRINQGQTEVFGRASGLPPRQVTTIRKDSAGNLWVRVRNEGVYLLPAGQSQFRRPDSPFPDKIMIGTPAIDSDGRLLLPSVDGLLIHDEQGWRKIGRSAGLRGDVYAVLEDRQHSLWMGMAGRGLVQWRGYGEWESYSAADGLASDVVYEILAEPGVLWAGTEGGLVRGERLASGIHWSKVAGLDGIPVHAVRAAPNLTVPNRASPSHTVSNQDLWVGTEMRGVGRLNLRSGQVQWFGEAQGLLGKAAYTLHFDREQRLWVGTEVGLFVATAPYARFTRVAELPSSRIWTIAEASNGTVWAGGAAGLFAFSGALWRNFKRSDGLSNQEVLSLGAGSNGTMWVGYRFGGGIDRVHLQTNGLAVEKGVQRPGTDGLIYFLEFDASGKLWAGTEHGVDVWNGARWSHYDMGDGLTWNDCNLNAFAEEPDGTVWIGTSGGLSRFKPRPSHESVAPLEVVFTRLLMGQTDVSNQINPSSGIHLSSLLAHYSALNASRENGVLFRYRLEGANSAWTETAQRELQFAQLAPGDYRLEVEAQDGDGVWNGHTAEFAFRILTPWYRSWWFILVCALIPAMAAAVVIRSRMAELRRRELELQRLMKAQDEIRNLAFYDTLTGLPNRRLLLDRLQKTLAASARSGRLRSLLFADLDNFKTLNDTLGHESGDMLLQEVARRLSACVREADTVSRLGGDEFMVMLEELSEVPEVAAAQAEIVAEKILHAVGEPHALDGREFLITTSIGITVFGNGLEGSNEVLKQAEIAMYQAKGAGRNTTRFFAPALQAAVNARAAMEEDLRLAIKTDQFLLYYQPQVSRGVPFGCEALIRWKHPERGLLLPGKFIPLAEESGLILPLGDWVLEAACRQIAAWANREETANLTVSVNISARQFRQPEFVERVLTAIDHSGANPKSLTLELTESVLVENVEEVIAKMTELKSHGLKFSLDDFGTGYSSLSYLKRLPLDELKIDLSFVRDALKDASGGAIVQAIISLGRAMSLPVIAEGVETEEQRKFLASLGCHAFQGYLFSRPVSVEDFERLLLKPGQGIKSGAFSAALLAAPWEE
jgi:diguanylate cyclase (GGDEF)-like protein